MKKKILIIFAIIFLIIIIGIVSLFTWYKVGLTAPTNNEAEIIVEIQSGTKTADILKILKENNVIRSENVAKIYLKLNKINNLQAGKYEFSGKDSLEEIIKILEKGKIKDETINITFLEGKNIRYIASTIAEKTNNTSNDVYNLLQDKEYIKSLIDKYWFLTKDIQNENIYYPLEGYLYPDTYTFENKDVSVKTIFEAMLDKMSKVLSKYKADNTNIHKILTMASIVELEGTSSENRPQIASVLYNRIKKNMSLGSDVTTYYAFKVDMGERNLTEKELKTYNAYNTRGPNMSGKLPVGPIANPSEESIKAALNPSNEDYLYFVADKNGKIYFSKTYEEHQKTISTLKNKGLWYEYEN